MLNAGAFNRYRYIRLNFMVHAALAHVELVARRVLYLSRHQALVIVPHIHYLSMYMTFLKVLPMCMHISFI
jgi:hypothetical protein